MASQPSLTIYQQKREEVMFIADTREAYGAKRMQVLGL
jgi:hypothetical protein